jgi:hypothetical protein
VGEAGGPESVGHVRRLGAVVAEGDAGEEAAVALRQRRRACGQGPAQAVRRPADRASRPPAPDHLDVEPARQVAMTEQRLRPAGAGDRPGDVHPLARQAVVERGRRRAPGRGPQSAPVEPDVGRDRAGAGRGRVADEHDLPGHGAGGQRRRQAGQ